MMRHIVAGAGHTRCALALVVLATLSGCASVSPEQNIGRLNADLAGYTDAQLVLARSDADRNQRIQAAALLLQAPVGQKEAVQLALVNSPAMQAMLAQGWADSADAAQSGRIANPLLNFQRLTVGDSLEFERTLSFGLLDILTWPARQGIAERRIEQAHWRLSSQIVDQVTQVKQAWVRAVAAQQKLQYAQQVFDSAGAGAELARRMQSVGNLNRLGRAREQSFYADAATRLATAQHQAYASREDLIRQLGLDEKQAQLLQLPERLPDLPKQALEPAAVGAMASQTRLDIRMAQNTLENAARGQGLAHITSVTDIELSVLRNTQFDHATGERSSPKAYEIGVRLPIFDWGGMQRDAWNAKTLAAAHQLEDTIRAAGSHLRESYSAYRTAHEVARHHRDEIIPVRKVISEENLLRYNAMIIGVFDLISDARDQVNAVTAAIDAEQQFWLAEAALHASLRGRPGSISMSVTTPSTPSAGGGGH